MKRLILTICLLLTGAVLGMALPGSASAAGMPARRSSQYLCADIRQGSLSVRWGGGTVQTGSAVPSAEASRDAADETAAVRREITGLTNLLRAERGLPALCENALLSRAAQVRAEELAAASIYAHTRPDGSHYSTVTDCGSVGENLHRISLAWLEHRDLDPAVYAVGSWTDSEGHLRNMVNEKAAAIGVGAAMGYNADGEESWYLVQLFLPEGCEITWVDGPVTQLPSA